MAFLDLFRSSSQKVQARIPATQRRLQALIRQKGDHALALWLQELALLGSSLRGARMQKLAADATNKGSRFDHIGSEATLWDVAAPAEWDWWAAQLVYNAGIDEGIISGGPGKVPDLWSEEFAEFSRAYFPLEVDEEEES